MDTLAYHAIDGARLDRSVLLAGGDGHAELLAMSPGYIVLLNVLSTGRKDRWNSSKAHKRELCFIQESPRESCQSGSLAVLDAPETRTRALDTR